MSAFSDEERRFEQTDLMAERLAERRKSRICLDVRSPEYNGPDDDEPDPKIDRKAVRAHLQANDRAATVGQIVNSLRTFLDAYDREDCVGEQDAEKARTLLAAWDALNRREP